MELSKATLNGGPNGLLFLHGFFIFSFCMRSSSSLTLPPQPPLSLCYRNVCTCARARNRSTRVEGIYMHACTARQDVSMDQRWQARASGCVCNCVCTLLAHTMLGDYQTYHLSCMRSYVLSCCQRACTRGRCPHFVFSCRQQHGGYILFRRASEHEAERCRQR